MTDGPTTQGNDADFSMDGRIALVTGGARGIGAAIAKRLNRSGARVAITRLDDPGSRDSAAALGRDLGAGDFMDVVADATDDAATAAAVAEVTRRFGAAPDTLVINAAEISKAPWTEIGVDGWDRLMAVNLRGAYIAAFHTVPAMRAAGYGKIITIGSVMGHIGDPRALHYVTSKHGLIGFTRSLARAEGASGVRVNCVVPGAIATEHHFEIGGTAKLGRLEALQAIPVRGWPDDIAAACQFLASHAGDFITAQVLTVDGGWTNY
jgi:3-oxoacyl-[acyl-carrier protein] reductase